MRPESRGQVLAKLEGAGDGRARQTPEPGSNSSSLAARPELPIQRGEKSREGEKEAVKRRG